MRYCYNLKPSFTKKDFLSFSGTYLLSSIFESDEDENDSLWQSYNLKLGFTEGSGKNTNR